MSGGQVAALIFAIILLIPGGCFLFYGIDLSGHHDEFAGLGATLLIVGLVILAVAGLLFWVAFRKQLLGTDQIVTLVFAMILVIPAVFFLLAALGSATVLGINILSVDYLQGSQALMFGLLPLLAAALLGWFAFRKRSPTAAQVAAAIIASILLVTGGWLLVNRLLADLFLGSAYSPSAEEVVVSLAMLLVAGLLGWIAFRKRPASPAARDC